MRKEFLTMALAATVVMSGFSMAQAVPCKVGEASNAAAQNVEAQKPAETCNLPKKQEFYDIM